MQSAWRICLIRLETSKHLRWLSRIFFKMNSIRRAPNYPSPTLDDLAALSVLFTTSTLFSGPFNPTSIGRFRSIHPDLYQYITACTYQHLIAPTLILHAEVEHALFEALRAVKVREDEVQSDAVRNQKKKILEAMEILEFKGPRVTFDNKKLKALDKKIHKGRSRRKNVKDMTLEEIEKRKQECEEQIKSYHAEMRQLSQYTALFGFSYDEKQGVIASNHRDAIKTRDSSYVQELDDVFYGRNNRALEQWGVLTRFDPEEYAGIWQRQIKLWDPTRGFLHSQRPIFDKVIAWARTIYATSTIELATLCSMTEAWEKQKLQKPKVIYQTLLFGNVEKARSFVVESASVEKKVKEFCNNLGEETKLEWSVRLEGQVVGTETEEGVELRDYRNATASDSQTGGRS